MGIGRQQKATWAVRGKIYSPGRPPVWQRDQVQRFWVGIAKGLSSEEAALLVGVSSPIGSRWFREAGGMRPSAWPRYLAVTCPSLSARRSPSSRRKAAVCGRSPDRQTVRPRRSAESCAAMPPPGRGRRDIGPSMRNGTLIAGRRDQRWPSWPPTRSCATTWRTGFRG